jgi:hypothetical protein
MLRHRSRARCMLAVALLVEMFVAGCTPKMTTGAFTQVNRLESEVQRGISTKMDVQRVLGVPKGFGSAAFPTDQRPREVWYYDDIEVIGMKSEGEGVIRANVRQQILLVFFIRELFDGFMWFSSAGEAVGQ